MPAQPGRAQVITRATAVRVVALPQQQQRSSLRSHRSASRSEWPAASALPVFDSRGTRMDARHRHGWPRLAGVRRALPLPRPDGHRQRQVHSRGRLRDRRDGPALRRGAQRVVRYADGVRQRGLTAARAAQRRGEPQIVALRCFRTAPRLGRARGVGARARRWE